MSTNKFSKFKLLNPNFVTASLGDICGFNILSPGQSEAVLEEVNISEEPAVGAASESEVSHQTSPVCVTSRHDDLVSVVDSNILVSVIRFSTFDICNFFLYNMKHFLITPPVHVSVETVIQRYDLKLDHLR